MVIKPDNFMDIFKAIRQLHCIEMVPTMYLLMARFPAVIRPGDPTPQPVRELWLFLGTY